MPLPKIEPPLINSSNPWATTAEDLQRLFDCEDTGAVTIRTSLLHGFEHDDSIHQYTFFSPQDHTLKSGSVGAETPEEFSASLNTLGYSPIPLDTYLSIIKQVVANSGLPQDKLASKPFIISVTGSTAAVKECYEKIQAVQSTMSNPLCMEINLSCPNIVGKPPPAYSGPSLVQYIQALPPAHDRQIPIGIKTPPYTYYDQFQTLINALDDCKQHLVDFITATNTLGSSLVLADSRSVTPAISSASGDGIGGMAGTPLHPLALGNVRTIRAMLDRHENLKSIEIIGIGGVSDAAGFDRMRTVGAKIVGIGTAFGREGVSVFAKIIRR